jgi:hypothetical protein
MRTQKTLTILCIITACTTAAFLFFAIQKEWIIIRIPNNIKTIPCAANRVCELYWHPSKLHTGKRRLLWTEDEQDNIHRLISCWLAWLYNEEMLKRINVETVMISPSADELFISFDKKLFSKNQSIHEKLACIHSLAQTIKPHTHARKMRLLVHHAPMEDVHIDCIESLPLDKPE